MKFPVSGEIKNLWNHQSAENLLDNSRSDPTKPWGFPHGITLHGNAIPRHGCLAAALISWESHVQPMWLISKICLKIKVTQINSGVSSLFPVKLHLFLTRFFLEEPRHLGTLASLLPSSFDADQMFQCHSKATSNFSKIFQIPLIPQLYPTYPLVI